MPGGNCTVKEFATTAQAAVPASQLVFTGEHGASLRTYTVSFDRILNELSGHFRPVWDLEMGGRELLDLFEEVGFSRSEFLGGICNRMVRINELVKSGEIDDSLRPVRT